MMTAQFAATALAEAIADFTPLCKRRVALLSRY